MNRLRAGRRARGTRDEYFSTLRKWNRWGGGVPIEKSGRKGIREFLDCVYERAVKQEGTNPGRKADKARENLRAVMSWAGEQDLIDTLPRFPKPREQRDVAGRHYLTKAEINALYFASHKMKRPRGWSLPIPLSRFVITLRGTPLRAPSLALEPRQVESVVQAAGDQVDDAVRRE
ncbi:hypothetical protein ACFL5Q_05250 [Planctomycetota bacterium]